jgi:signal peptidase I
MKRGWLVVVCAGAALAWLRPFRVEVAGTSMEPALGEGDWLVATRAGRINRGSVVVLRHPDGSLDLVKRVVAVPGDVIESGPLGPDEYLVIGDNLARSTDGRSFGTVGRDAIEGVVRLRYRPGLSLVR